MFKSDTDPHFISCEREILFEALARNLTDKGYSIHANALPNELSQRLWDLQQGIPSNGYQKAGIGRRNNFKVDGHIRKDDIFWIDDSTGTGAEWNHWAASLQAFLNARLYLGLFSFESHFSRFTNGDYYQRHRDAFLGRDNRVLSIVTYLNRDWVNTDAGELVLYASDGLNTPIIVPPQFGTLVAFLSEEIPHEVLVTNCDRLSIAGWFRLNGSNETRIDLHR